MLTTLPPPFAIICRPHSFEISNAESRFTAIVRFHDSTGSYSVHLQRLTAAQRCGGTIGCDTPSTTAVGSPALADSNLHSISAVAKERVYIAFRGDTAPSFNPVWRLLSPAGTPVAGCGTFTTLSTDCTLPTAGSYAIEVLDSTLDGSGSYHLDLQRLTAGQRLGRP